MASPSQGPQDGLKAELLEELWGAAADALWSKHICFKSSMGQPLVYRLKSVVAAIAAIEAGKDPKAAWEHWAHPDHPWEWDDA